MVKLNEGLSGEGNAAFHFDDAPVGEALVPWIRERLPKLAIEAKGMTWHAFLGKVQEMGAVVEAFIEGDEKRSPSAQFRIDPFGYVEAVSTHDQVLDRACLSWAAGFLPTQAYRRRSRRKAAKVAACSPSAAC